MTKLEKLDRKYSRAQELIASNNDGSIETDRVCSMGLAFSYLNILRANVSKKDDYFSVFDDRDDIIRNFEKELDRVIEKYQ